MRSDQAWKGMGFSKLEFQWFLFILIICVFIIWGTELVYYKGIYTIVQAWSISYIYKLNQKDNNNDDDNQIQVSKMAKKLTPQ